VSSAAAHDRQLWGQRDIRYEFEITNQKTGKRIVGWLRVHQKFGGIRVFDEYGGHKAKARAPARLADDSSGEKELPGAR